jgi:hypothetical protein
MGRLRDWWDRVTGAATATTETPRRTDRPTEAEREHRPPGELTLADEPAGSKASRTGRAGFDPYSSDAGYTKPHSWERVDHD